MLTKQTVLPFALIVVVACGVCAFAQTPAARPMPTPVASPTTVPAATPDDSTVGNISGSIVNEGGQPLAGVQVLVRARNSGMMPRSSTTDAEGNFHFNGLLPALYFVTASAPAYVTPEENSNIPSRDYRIGDTARIELVRGGVITGTVTNAAGEPLIGVPVRAIVVRDPKGQPPAMSTYYFRERSTDDRGVYRIFGLAPGTYIVAAGGPGMNQRFQLSPYDSDAPTFAPASTRDGATEVTVRSGDETTVDIRYRADTGHSINGSVKISGTSENGASVALSYGSGGFMPLTNSFQMPGGNSFSFAGLPDGDYVLVAQSMTSSSGVFSPSQMPDISLSEPRRVTIKGADVSGVELVPQPLSSINGHIALEPSKVAECQNKRHPLFTETLVKVEAPEKDRQADAIPLLRMISGSASPDAKGNFTVRNLVPGRYGPQLTFYARYWYLDSVSVAATPKFDAAANWMTLKSGERAQLTMTLAEGAASIRGRMGEAASGVGVYLLPADREKTADVLRYFVTTVAADGTFAFNNLPPGRYLVLSRTLDADTSTTAKLRLPESVEARTKLRRAAETQKTNLELKPCQNLTDYELKQSAP